MRHLLTLCLLFVPVLLQAQTVAYPPLLLRDEGIDKGRLTRAIDFTGAGVICTWSAGVGTCTVSAGGGGNFVEVSLAMTGGVGSYSTTVTGQAWVAADSEIVCASFGTTADSLTPEQVSLANLSVITSARVVGTGFTLIVYNPTGSHGTHRFHCTGA
jgi:hypothetical protein